MKNTTKGILVSIPAFVVIFLIGYFLGGGGFTGTVVGLVIGMLAVLVIMLTFGLIKSQTTRKYTGRENLVGSIGTVREALTPEGWAMVNGMLWKARSTDGSNIEKNERIQVVALDGLTVIVKKL